MKKTYLKPVTKWELPIGDEALMEDDFQDVSMDVNDSDTDDEVDDFDDLLSNEAVSVWEEDY